jgi:hypothetical protein
MHIKKESGRYENFSFVLLLIIYLLIFSCEFSSDSKSNLTGKFEYPLKIGNAWEYERVFEIYNFRPDSLRSIFSETKYVSRSIVEVKKDTTLQDSLQCKIVQEKLIEHQEFLSWAYYANKTEGLYELAYKNGGGGLTMPKEHEEVEYTVGGISFNNMRDVSDYFAEFLSSNAGMNDTLIYWKPERKVLTYPPEPGEEWLMFQGPPFTIHKKIVGKESVSTDAGNYNCYKIQWIYTGMLDDNIIFYDYVSKKGLIKRSILFKDILVSDVENPDGIGYVDASDETILTDINF